MTQLNGTAKDDLRRRQRAWIKERDAACGLDEHQTNRDQWYQDVLRDYRKAVCATRFAQDRTTEASIKCCRGHRARLLLQLCTALSPAITCSRAKHREPADGTLEITIDPAKISASGATAVWWGCRLNQTSTGSLTRVHSTDLERPIVRGGIALDLDVGKVYVRRDGQWLEGAPGNSEGTDVTPGQPYHCGVETTVPIAPSSYPGSSCVSILANPDSTTHSRQDTGH